MHPFFATSTRYYRKQWRENGILFANIAIFVFTLMLFDDIWWHLIATWNLSNSTNLSNLVDFENFVEYSQRFDNIGYVVANVHQHFSDIGNICSAICRTFSLKKYEKIWKIEFGAVHKRVHFGDIAKAATWIQYLFDFICDNRLWYSRGRVLQGLLRYFEKQLFGW